MQELIHCDESLSCESVTMPAAENTEGENDMNAMKAMVNSLAQSVQTLTSRVAAPSDQLKKSEELTTTLEYQQRCLKRERECAPKQQGIVKQQNLLDELQTRVKAIAAKVETAPVVVLDDPLADLAQPVKVKRGLLADTDEGKAILLALGATDKLLASRLLDLSVVCAASSNAIGWSVVESLTGASWRNYCTDDKHALVVKTRSLRKRSVRPTRMIRIKRSVTVRIGIVVAAVATMRVTKAGSSRELLLSLQGI